MPESCSFEADKLLIRLDVTFKADVDSISPVVDAALDTARRMGCARGHEMDIEIACARPWPTPSSMAAVVTPPSRCVAVSRVTSRAAC